MGNLICRVLKVVTSLYFEGIDIGKSELATVLLDFIVEVDPAGKTVAIEYLKKI